MFLRPLDRIRRTIGFQLTLWYSTLFILSSLVAFGFMYFILSAYLEQHDREGIQLELKEYAEEYQTMGMEVLEEDILLEKRVDKLNAPFVRIADPNNKTLFISGPNHSADFYLGQLEKEKLLVADHWVVLRGSEGHESLEINSLRLSDDNLLQLGKSVRGRMETLARFRQISALIMIPMILFGFAGGAFLAFRTLRPIRNLIHSVRSIEKGEMHTRVPRHYTGDELDDLVTLFNAMLERIESLIKGMRAALDNVAHDLRTPMMRLRSTIELALQSEQSESDSRETLMDCAEESERIMTMLNTLMDISEAETGVLKLNVEQINVASLIEDAVELYSHVADEKKVVLYVEVPGELSLNADRNRMSQVMANLLDNAIKYTSGGGRVVIKAYQRGEDIVMVIEDNGDGIPLEELPRIWDRLYRGDKSRSHRGLGLGLSLVKAVVQSHGGSIEVSSEPNKGSRFTLVFPVHNYA